MALFLYSIQAAQLPDGETLMKQVDDAYQSFRTLQYKMETTMQQPGQGDPYRKPTTTKCVIGRSGKRRLESSSPRGTFISVWDGSTEWHYDPVRNEYTKATVAASGPDAPADTTDRLGPRVSHRTLRQEAIEIDGQKYDCWVVETRLSDSGTANPDTETTEEVTTQWIDKKLLLERRSIQSIKTQRAGKVTAHLITQVSKDFRINEPVAVSTFTFVPPPDAEEVRVLFARPKPSADLFGQGCPRFSSQRRRWQDV